MGESSGTDRGGFPEGDSSYKGKISNVRDLATIRNAEVYREMKQGIARYHSVMGVRQRNVKLADLPLNTNGVHATLGGQSEGVYLNAKIFDKMTKQQIKQRVTKAYESGWSTKTNKPVQHTITHELAHATWNNRLTSPQAQAAGKEIKKLATQWYKDKNKKGYGEYAQTNTNEFWAEVVAKAVHGTPDKYTRAVKAIVKKYKL